MTRRIGTVAAGLTLGLMTSPAWAIGGSFVCERSPSMEVRDQVDGSFALENIVNQYRIRWDAQEAMKPCRAYAEGQPYEISCLNGRRDWDAILASVPQEYFGKSNKNLASSADMEERKDSGFKEAMTYCRSVGAIY